MLKLTTSNRYERLEGHLLQALTEVPPSPFTAQQVIVPSAGIKRAIELKLALQSGICANIHFDYLAQWLWREFAKIIPISDHSPFSVDLLAWRIFSIFHDADLAVRHPRLDRYLQNADDLMRFDLARRCAQLFDQYLTYRPDWLENWLRPDPILDSDEAWQAELWRRIAAQIGAEAHHPSLRFFSVLRGLSPEAIAESGLSESVQIFCPPSIPKLYLQMLRDLSRWMDIHIYAINPCAEYWFEIVNPKRLGSLRLKARDQHHEIGNQLLASWGQQSKEHLAALLDHDCELIEVDDFHEGQPETLLAAIQNSVLQMVDLEPGSLNPEVRDRSLEIHVCHSLTRELEVLHDQLLEFFTTSNPPCPSEVLVVIPDLDTAAPVIESVFGKSGQALKIPYQITGRSAKTLNPFAKTLLALLSFASSRFAADAFIALIQQASVSKRFGLEHEDISLIQKWFDESGIRWGINAEHREQLGLPGVDTYSFLDGLDRLFLGYAMPASDTTPIGQRLAAGNAQGQDALILGGLHCLLDALVALHHELAITQKAESWHRLLLFTIETFFQTDQQSAPALRETREAIHVLYRDLTAAQFDEPLSFSVVYAALEASLMTPMHGAVPTGAVTITSLNGLRFLPYRFIAVLGLSDDAFPGKRRPLEFDLMARKPRPGDRQRRTDDRGLFLDLLIAARDRFYISYTGRSIRDHARLAPSVVIAELLDYAAVATAVDPLSPDSLNEARNRLIVEHPLQAFSLDYFIEPVNPRKKSFHAVYRDAQAQRLHQQGYGAERKVFFSKALPEPGNSFRRLSVQRLTEFFMNPSRYILRYRLGVVLSQARAPIDACEPFTTEHRDRQSFAARVLPSLLQSRSSKEVSEIAQASLEFAQGPMGAWTREQELESLTEFANELKTQFKAPVFDRFTETIELEVGTDVWQLDFSCSDLRPHGLVRYRYAKASCYDYLSAWIEHIALNAVKTHGAADRRLRWFSRDGCFELRPIEDARQQLHILLDLYRQGLSLPLHFYPRSAWAFVSHAMSHAEAAKVWYPDNFNGLGESLDPAYQLALRGVSEALDEDFKSNADTVFSPLFAALCTDTIEGRA